MADIVTRNTCILNHCSFKWLICHVHTNAIGRQAELGCRCTRFQSCSKLHHFMVLRCNCILSFPLSAFLLVIPRRMPLASVAVSACMATYKEIFYFFFFKKKNPCSLRCQLTVWGIRTSTAEMEAYSSIGGNFLSHGCCLKRLLLQSQHLIPFVRAFRRTAVFCCPASQGYFSNKIVFWRVEVRIAEEINGNHQPL